VPSLVSTLYKVTTGGTVTPTSIRVGDPKNLEVDETPSAAGEYVFVTLWGSLARVGRMGGPFTGLVGIPYVFAHDMVLDGVRNVSTVGSGTNRWEVLVDFPYDPGFTYAILLGRSGYRPGVTLPDLRRLRLNPDAATWAGLAGALPGTSGLAGTLDARGTARGVIDLSRAPASARGQAFWMVGVVLDPASPSSIRRISPPVVLQLR